MKVLVTGTAGFIGSHVSMYLMARGDDVVCLDNFNEYYDVNLKYKRAERLAAFSKGMLKEDVYPEAQQISVPRGRYRLEKIDLMDRVRVAQLFAEENFDAVIHLAAQAGVRHSLDQPFDYVDSNITGFLTILEGCRHNNVAHLVYASTSSVYGNNTNMPFSVQQPADHQVALYGATKRANELMAHSYSHLFGIATTGLRFFTVYGPWGRPDMALFLFTKAILAGQPIDIYNNGNHFRDFTYVDDIVRGIVGVLDKPAQSDPDWDSSAPHSYSSNVPWCIHNVGSGNPVKLMNFIAILEDCLGKKAEKNFLPLQSGDVPGTSASVETLVDCIGYKPSTKLEDGIARFVEWYKGHYC